MTSRPICTNSRLKSKCRKGSVSKNRGDVWLRLLGLKTDARSKGKRRDEFEHMIRETFGSDTEDMFSIPTGLLSNLPMIHRENETDPIFVDLIKSNIPEEESPRLQQRKSASKISTDRESRTRIACVILILLQHKTLIMYAGSVFHLIILLLHVVPESEAYFMVLTMITHTKRRRGAYFHLDQHHEWAGSHSMLNMLAKYNKDIFHHDDDVRATKLWFETVQRWHLTFFHNVFPDSFRLRILDCFLCEGRKVLIRLTIGILTSTITRLHYLHEISFSSVERFQKSVYDCSELKHEEILRNSFGIRNFKRKNIEESFKYSLRKIPTFVTRDLKSWDEVLRFRGHHLKRHPLLFEKSSLKSSNRRECEVSRAVPVASSSSKTLVKRSIKAKSGSEGFICIQCRGMFDSMSDLTKHSQRHSSGIFGARSDEKDGVLLCTNGILSRLRWWRLKEIAFEIAGSLSDIHDEPKLVYSSNRHGFGLENLEQRWDKQFSRKSKKSPLCVILIRTSKGKILGAFTSGHLRQKAFTGRSNLKTRHFTLFGYDEKLKDLSVYRSLCGPPDEGDEGLYALMITANTIVIGGGVKTTEGLLLSADLQSGHSKPCLLFKSPSLIQGEKFNVTNIEVFCVCSDLP